MSRGAANPQIIVSMRSNPTGSFSREFPCTPFPFSLPCAPTSTYAPLLPDEDFPSVPEPCRPPRRPGSRDRREAPSGRREAPGRSPQNRRPDWPPPVCRRPRPREGQPFGNGSMVRLSRPQVNAAGLPQGPKDRKLFVYMVARVVHNKGDEKRNRPSSYCLTSGGVGPAISHPGRLSLKCEDSHSQGGPTFNESGCRPF